MAAGGLGIVSGGDEQSGNAGLGARCVDWLENWVVFRSGSVDCRQAMDRHQCMMQNPELVSMVPCPPFPVLSHNAPVNT